MKNRAFLLILLISIIPTIFGFSANARNTLEYRGAKEDRGNSFFEDRLDLRLNYSNITFGLTFEAMQPSRESALTRPDSTYAEIMQRWFELKHSVVEISAGTFTSTMGGGLLLDARERREIQQDHHLDGAKIRLNLPIIDITLLSGLAKWDVINDAHIRGGEAQIDVPLPVGGGYIRYDVQAEGLPDLIGETWEARIVPMFGPLSAEVHYAQTWQKDLQYGDSYNGEVIYGSGSTFFGPITLFGEFLMADSFLVEGYGDTLVLTTLPLIIRQPSYTLMSRHLAELDPRDVTAFGGEALISPVFGSDITTSFAMLDNPDDYNDYFELYCSVFREWEKLTFTGIYEFQQTSDDPPTHNVVLEPLIYLNDRTSLLMDFELQFGEELGESAAHLYGLAEFARSPYGAIGLEGGRLMQWNDETAGLEPEYFARIYIDGEIAQNHKLTLAFGKRPGGFTCSGGTCRFEPAFNGFELKLSSSF